MNKGHKIVQKKRIIFRLLVIPLRLVVDECFLPNKIIILILPISKGAFPLFLAWKPVSLNENNIENDLTKLKTKYTRSCQERVTNTYHVYGPIISI